jgi:hypothetical protein
MSKPFGFAVEPEPIWGSDGYAQDVTGWRVYLPHQCDAWDIAGEMSAGAPHAEAVAALELFIAEAQVALAQLRKAAA